MPDRKRRQVVLVDQTAIAHAVGARIRSARIESGLTQRQLAGPRYTPAYISALECGHAKPSVASLFYLAERLGREPAEFLGGLPRRQRSLGTLQAAAVRFTDSRLYIVFRDQAELGAPLTWFPALRDAPMSALQRWKVSADGQHISWPDLDVTVEVPALLGGSSTR